MKLINWIIDYYREWKRKRKIKKKLEEMRKRDPFIYDH